MSGGSTDERDRTFLEAYDDRLLVKPVSIAELELAVVGMSRT